MKAETIIFLITALERGGAETQVERVASRLVEQGRAVHIMSMLEIGAKEEAQRLEGVQYHSMGMKRGGVWPGDMLSGLRRVREISPDVLASFCFHANIVGSLMGRLTSVPVVISSIRNEYFGGRHREWAESACDFLRLRDAVTTNSAFVARSLVQRGIVPERKVEVVPNGIVCSNYRCDESVRREVRQALEVEDDQFLWLAVGNIRAQKDYPSLIRAFRELVKVREDARLIIAGRFVDERIVGDLEALIEELPEGAVELLGGREDIPELLAAADGLVLSSTHEGLPNVVMEALAASVPVVATEVGGVGELVVNGKSGILVEPGNVRGLSEALVSMMNLEDEELEAMGQSGFLHIKENFSLREVVQRWDQLFARLLDEK